MSSGDFEDDWEPVSPAEMKVIQAKQERSNKISKIMGDYLLKGYKMLATSCEDCGCILLQDKQGQYHCVACNECEVEGSKDDPALSRIAADSKIREGASPVAVTSSSAAATAVGTDDDAALAVDASAASLPACSALTSSSSSSSTFATGGIPSLMNAAPLLNGNAVASGGGGGGSAFGSGGGGGSGSNLNGDDAGATGGADRSAQPKGRPHRGKISSKGNRASAVGVRSLMCDVGRNAYEAFAAYQDDSVSPSPTAPPVSSAPIATVSAPAAHATTVKSRTPPPHGPSVWGEFGKLAPKEHESLSGTLKRKLISAGQRLEKSNSVDEDKALCALIKNYAEALEAVNSLQNS